ncbi:cytokinin dehydrogenase [Musa troglodytarum]|uniref:Cytokinin dehydrogenase n=1 Tax=Musa troglodytarum TaxID=320322 RepID=A0A9E7I1R6_9LILI|nr:cytokinin dehydrogenase [Musa troglodytarum]
MQVKSSQENTVISSFVLLDLVLFKFHFVWSFTSYIFTVGSIFSSHAPSPN